MAAGWAEASLQYMRSGGFMVSSKVPSIATETLVLWGRQDKILDPKLYAERYSVTNLAPVGVQHVAAASANQGGGT